MEQVRQHFRSKGVSKSKDTFQRWCRTGELFCQKRGVLNRYFTPEASLNVLDPKLQPDWIAETSGEIAPPETPVQLHTAAASDAHSGMPLNEGADADAGRGTQVQEGRDVQAHAAARVEQEIEATVAPDHSCLAAENEGL